MKTLIETYKGRNIVNNDGVIEIVNGDSVFVIGIDDSKNNGCKKFNEEFNNIETAKVFIDWETKTN